jgi:hypothetical protein
VAVPIALRALPPRQPAVLAAGDTATVVSSAPASLSVVPDGQRQHDISTVNQPSDVNDRAN